MDSQVFRLSLTRTEALAGDPYISDTEQLQCYPCRDWHPWNVRLHRYGAISVDLRHETDDARAGVSLQFDNDNGKDSLATAVVDYVAGLGDFSDSELMGRWCGEVLERVAGALEASQRKHAERMTRITTDAGA